MPDNNGRNKRGVSRNQTASNSDVMADNGSSVETSESHYVERRIKGKYVRENTLTASVTGFVNDVITHVNPNSKEIIIWTKIQHCQTDVLGRISTILLIIGLARGYQIYIMENADFEEVLSIRKEPLKNGHMLPFKIGKNDRLCEHRPIFVTTFDPSSNNKFNVNFLSLRTGKNALQLSFNKPVLDFNSTQNCFLIVFTDVIIIYNHEDLTERMQIEMTSTFTHYAASANLLAYSHNKLDQKLLCCYISQNDCTFLNNQVLKTAKNISKTVGSLVSSISNPHVKNNIIPNTMGVITIVNTDGSLKSTIKNNDVDFIAHFYAHKDSSIGHLMFGNGGQLLLTGSSSSTAFNVFLLHFHPKTCALTSIQRIYKLVRGNSIAKVIGSAFSYDNRWLAVSTNHGTTHLFTITPYGGPITSRTHLGKFMNKESLFENTTGIGHFNHMQYKASFNSKSAMHRLHPVTNNSTILKTAFNSHTSIYETNFVVLNSSLLARQRNFTSGNIRAWASDNTSAFLPNSNDNKANQKYPNQKESASKRSVTFIKQKIVMNQIPYTTPSMLIIENDGFLMRYDIQHNEILDRSKISLPSMEIEENSLTDEATFENNLHGNLSIQSDYAKKLHKNLNVKLSKTIEWELTRNNGRCKFEVINPPLAPNNPLLKLCSTGPKLTRKTTKIANNIDWLYFLEVTTYIGPHRRLWLGPQFSFNIYTSTNIKEQLIADINFVQHKTTHKCCPVLIEGKSHDIQTSLKIAKIVCGSWSSEFDDNRMVNNTLKESIDDAMREANSKEQDMEDKSVFSCRDDLMTLSGMEF